MRILDVFGAVMLVGVLYGLALLFISQEVSLWYNRTKWNRLERMVLLVLIFLSLAIGTTFLPRYVRDASLGGLTSYLFWSAFASGILTTFYAIAEHLRGTKSSNHR